MNRKEFIALISSIPFIGWLVPNQANAGFIETPAVTLSGDNQYPRIKTIHLSLEHKHKQIRVQYPNGIFGITNIDQNNLFIKAPDGDNYYHIPKIYNRLQSSDFGQVIDTMKKVVPETDCITVICFNFEDGAHCIMAISYDLDITLIG